MNVALLGPELREHGSVLFCAVLNEKGAEISGVAC